MVISRTFVFSSISDREIMMKEAPDLNDGYCSICFDSSKFRVLQCGHAFCLDCLQTMHAYHGGKILCPMDRREDAREPRTLPTPHQFQGRVFIPAVDDDERHMDFNYLLDAQIEHRLHTIRKLRTLASTLDGHEFNCAIAKVTGSVAGVSSITISDRKFCFNHRK